MRTTVTLDPDTDAAVRRLMRERGLTFRQAVNAAIRAGTGTVGRRRRFATRTFDMGTPTVSLDRALQLAADLETEERRRKLAARK